MMSCLGAPVQRSACSYGPALPVLLRCIYFDGAEIKDTNTTVSMDYGNTRVYSLYFVTKTNSHIFRP